MRNESGNRTYNIPAIRITSGDELKYRKGLGFEEERSLIRRAYETILRRAQGTLKRKGLYGGAEDGAFSPALREAVRKFQQQQGLTATGIPDPATLWTLLNP